ncbi:MAG: hypothetical protein R2861_08615 [Desulfobacterales bacterium]
MVLPLIVFQKESIQLIDEAMSKNRLIGTVTSKFTDPKPGIRRMTFTRWGRPR